MNTTNEDNICPITQDRMTKVQMYVPPDLLELATAIANKRTKPLGAVNREIWEEGLIHYIEKANIVDAYKERIEGNGA